MKKTLIYFFLVLVLNMGTIFQAKAATLGVLQYCFYQGKWSLIFKYEKNFKNNTQWCKIVKKSENLDFYNELFKKTRAYDGKFYIETATLKKIVNKQEAIENKYKQIENEILAKQKKEKEKEKEKKKLLAKQKEKEVPDDEKIVKKLNDLAEEYRSGNITEEEFISKKTKLLNNEQ
jgi:hypothetical protein